ncbi:MAG: outer membrane protein [Parvibaculaceae bacterium]
MLRRLLLVGAVLTAGTTAEAADVEAPAIYDWSGFYAGVHAGYGWGDGGGVDFDEFFAPGFGEIGDGAVAAGYPETIGKDLEGMLGGGQVGYNIQTDRLVIGIEADLSYLGMDEKESTAFPGGIGGNVLLEPGTASVRQSLDYLGTARLRLGYALDRTLLYVTGGLAYGDKEFRFATTSGPASFAGGKSDTALGWSLGGGFEYAILDATTLRLEYLYYDLGRLSSTAAAAQDERFTQSYSAEFRGNIVRAGVNVRF